MKREMAMESIVEAIEKISQKNMVDYFIAIVPIALSLVAIYISIDSTKKQNKIALLDKRLAIYTDLKMCISNVIVEGKVTTQNVNLFLFKSRDVKFLFDEEFDELCKKIYKSMLELRRTGVKVEEGIRGKNNVSSHEGNVDVEDKLLYKMFEYSKELEEAALPYISFSKSKKH